MSCSNRFKGIWNSLHRRLTKCNRSPGRRHDSLVDATRGVVYKGDRLLQLQGEKPKSSTPTVGISEQRSKKSSNNGSDNRHKDIHEPWRAWFN